METGLYFVSSEGPRVEGWSRSARVESLIPWTEYQLGVSAVNSAGEGGIAGVSQGQVCRTPPDVPGRSPLDVCTDSRKPRQLVIVWEVRLFIPGMICRRQLCRYCFYSRAVFLVFRPAGAIRCNDQGEIWHGPLLRAKFHLDRSRGGGYGPQN